MGNTLTWIDTWGEEDALPPVLESVDWAERIVNIVSSDEVRYGDVLRLCSSSRFSKAPGDVISVRSTSPASMIPMDAEQPQDERQINTPSSVCQWVHNLLVLSSDPLSVSFHERWSQFVLALPPGLQTFDLTPILREALPSDDLSKEARFLLTSFDQRVPYFAFARLQYLIWKPWMTLDWDTKTWSVFLWKEEGSDDLCVRHLRTDTYKSPSRGKPSFSLTWSVVTRRTPSGAVTQEFRLHSHSVEGCSFSVVAHQRASDLSRVLAAVTRSRLETVSRDTLAAASSPPDDQQSSSIGYLVSCCSLATQWWHRTANPRSAPSKQSTPLPLLAR
ncbi:hypothetical protein DIPPA_07545 [Diplonema papillatum]|nr:hypothetical protein DIPPA_07545 [Diplonema papillatum]